MFIGLLFCTVSVHYALSVPFAGWASRPRRLGSSAIMSMGLVRPWLTGLGLPPRKEAQPRPDEELHCHSSKSFTSFHSLSRFSPCLARPQLACAVAFLLTGPSPMFSVLGPAPTITLAACAMGARRPFPAAPGPSLLAPRSSNARASSREPTIRF